MIGLALLPRPIRKEARALALPWLACMAVVIVPAIVHWHWLGGMSAFAYFIGAVSLGALSIGREQTDGTLSLLLSLPQRRERLLLVKLGVLTLMLLALWATAAALLYLRSGVFRASLTAASMLPVLCALFVAPWLTMVSRNTIAGAVFTMAVPGVLMIAGGWLGAALYGSGRDMEAFRTAMLWRGTLGVCAIGAVATWWTFTRLEAIEGSRQDLDLSSWLRRPAAARTAAPSFTRRHTIWLLVKKELQLQQMTLVLAGLYLIGWIAIRDDAFDLITLSYAGFTPLLIGALASAGERQLDTLEWQLLLPMAASKQWAIKIGVVLSLTILLAIGLPSVLTSLRSAGDPTVFLQPRLAVVIVLLTAGSLYVSSLCNSALMALMVSLPVTLAALMIPGLLIVWAVNSSWRLSGAMSPAVYGRPGSARVIGVVSLLVVAGILAVMQRMAFSNHRSAERNGARRWLQVILAAAFVTAGAVAVAGMGLIRFRL